MEEADYLNRVNTALGARGFEVSRAEVAGCSALAGRRSDFRWRWFAVRLHSAVIVAPFSAGEATRARLDEFLDAASHWTVRNRRGSRMLGLQSGTAAIAVAVLPDGPGGSREWAEHAHGRRFAAVAYPVAVDLRSGAVVQPGRMIVGGIFAGFLRSVVRDVIEAPLQ